MSVKYVKRNNYDKAVVDKIVDRGTIARPLAKLLAGRGVNSYDEAVAFLFPDKEQMVDPREIYGMKDAADRVKKAIDNNESILIYGDYDCDGLTAISIIYKFLCGKITNLNYYVPKRHAEGYGLHNIVIEDLTDKLDLDLIITVDCGVTSKNEVEYIKSRGVDIVVTDHHEPIDGLLPDCVVVDAKLNKVGFSDYCGAGIAMKLVEAIAGRDEALKYVDYAAIGTIADIVPLLGENRVIAKLGLDKLNLQQTPASRQIISLLNHDKLTANDIMFRIAPRINALGRLKDASPVVEFFTSDDVRTLGALLLELEDNNKERQELCECVVSDIMDKLRNYDLKENRIIVMADKGWNIGVLGIAASKLAEMFNRPVVLFTDGGDGLYRGSARSNNKINIFECLSQCQEYFVAFGGHSAAAGISMEPRYFHDFCVKINSIIKKQFGIEYFYPDFVYDLKISRDVDYDCIEQFQKLEPCGFCNPVPVFLLENATLKFQQIGTTKHIKSYYNNIELVAFNNLQFIESLSGETSYIFTLQNKTYRQKKYTQGLLKSFNTIYPANINEELVCVLYLMYNLYLPYKNLKAPVNICRAEDINDDDGLFGNLYIAFSTQTYYNFIEKAKKNNKFLMCDIFASEGVNPYNRIVLSPDMNYPYKYYKNIYFLDAPVTTNFVSSLQMSTNAHIFLIGKKRVNIELIKKIRCNSVEEYRDIFRLLKKNNFFGAKDMMDLGIKLLNMRDRVSIFKVLSTLYIMIELGIVYIKDNDGFKIIKDRKNNLENSIIYNYIHDFS